MGKLKLRAMAVALCVGVATAAMAAGYFTNGVPVAGGTQYPSTIPLTGNETLPADTNLPSGANPASEAITTLQLSGFAGALQTSANALVGGDAGQNLFVHGTTGASQTTTVGYGGPNNFVYWSGANTAVTLSKDTTAGDFPTGYSAAFKLARTSGQTGVVQVCMAQEVESANSYRFQGGVAELDFNAVTGANFSAASANMTAYIVYGTGTDQGTTNLAFGLNAGGGGSSGWTGQTNATAAVISLGGVSTAGRYVAVANIPTTATELAVALCYTPVGTAGTNDYVAFSGIQLKVSAQLAQYVSATVGYSATVVPASAFGRSLQAIETVYQERYAYALNEASITAGAVFATGQAPTATTCTAIVPFPVTMRAAPTYTNALSGTTFKLNSAAANVVLTTPFSATAGANTVNNGSVTFTASTLGATPGFGCELVSAAGTGQMLFTSEL
jgi:hypothetical protein